MPILRTHQQYSKLFDNVYRPRIKNEKILKSLQILKSLPILVASKIFAILYFVLIKAVCRLINPFVYIVKRIIFLKQFSLWLCSFIFLKANILPKMYRIKKHWWPVAIEIFLFHVYFSVEPAKDWITFSSTFHHNLHLCAHILFSLQ